MKKKEIKNKQQSKIPDPFNVKSAPRKSNKEGVLVSSYLPPVLAEHLALNALVSGQTRSLILTKAVYDYVNKKGVKFPEMVKILGKQVKVTWETIKTRGEFYEEWEESKEKAKYIDGVKEILKKRGVTEKTIELIIKESGIT